MLNESVKTLIDTSPETVFDQTIWGMYAMMQQDHGLRVEMSEFISPTSHNPDSTALKVSLFNKDGFIDEFRFYVHQNENDASGTIGVFRNNCRRIVMHIFTRLKLFVNYIVTKGYYKGSIGTMEMGWKGLLLTAEPRLTIYDSIPDRSIPRSGSAFKCPPPKRLAVHEIIHVNNKNHKGVYDSHVLIHKPSIKKFISKNGHTLAKDQIVIIDHRGSPTIMRYVEYKKHSSRHHCIMADGKLVTVKAQQEFIVMPGPQAAQEFRSEEILYKLSK